MSEGAQSAHICKCGKIYQHFSSYKTHALKGKCKSIPQQNDKTLTQLVNTQLEIPHVNINTSSTNSQQEQSENNTPIRRRVLKFNPQNVERMLADRNKVSCDYCYKEYTPNNISRHKQLHCKKRYKALWEYEQLIKYGIINIPESVSEVKELYYRLAYEDKLSNPIRNQTNVIQPTSQIINNNTQNNSIGVVNQIVNQTVNQTINNTNNITQNIIQNKIVIIQPIMHEDLSHISIEQQKEIILLRAKSYKALLDHIYSNRANHNVCFTDKPGKKKVKFLDTKLGITNGGSYDKLGDISMQHLEYLDNYIQTHKNSLPEQYKNDIKYLEDYLANENNNDTLIYQFFDKVDTISNSSKVLLDLHDQQTIHQFVGDLIKNKQLAAIGEKAKLDALAFV